MLITTKECLKAAAWSVVIFAVVGIGLLGVSWQQGMTWPAFGMIAVGAVAIVILFVVCCVIVPLIALMMVKGVRPGSAFDTSVAEEMDVFLKARNNTPSGRSPNERD